LGALEALEMVGWSLALPILKHMLPTGRLAGVLWTPSRPPRSESRERAVVAASARLTRLRPGLRANCLERSLLAYRFLARAGADPRLVLGVGTLDGAVVGHAWVTLDGDPVHESREAVSGFTPLVEFGEAGRPSHVASDAGALDLPRVW
jgi:hypothetical protein